MSDEVALDSSALLALLRAEPGADQVARLLPRAVMSAVNLAETLIVLERNGVPLAAAEESLQALMIRIVPADASVARAAAQIAASTRAQGLSLGDYFCLAPAASLGLPVVTADRAWAKLRLGVRITVVR